jgi:hypothetical protein
VPRPGELVLMLRGAQKMQRARLLQKDSKVMMMLILISEYDATCRCRFLFLIVPQAGTCSIQMCEDMQVIIHC